MNFAMIINKTEIGHSWLDEMASKPLGLIQHWTENCDNLERSVNHRSQRMLFSEEIGSSQLRTSPAPSAGKHVRPCHDWFWFCFSLVEKVARVLQLLTNHRAQ